MRRSHAGGIALPRPATSSTTGSSPGDAIDLGEPVAQAAVRETLEGTPGSSARSPASREPTLTRNTRSFNNADTDEDSRLRRNPWCMACRRSLLVRAWSCCLLGSPRAARRSARLNQEKLTLLLTAIGQPTAAIPVSASAPRSPRCRRLGASSLAAPTPALLILGRSRSEQEPALRGYTPASSAATRRDAADVIEPETGGRRWLRPVRRGTRRE
jgi:hypothetical protein